MNLPCSSSSSSDSEALRLPYLFSISPWQCVSQVLSCLKLLHSLSVREADSRGQIAVGPLRGVSHAVVPVLLTVGAGLYFLMTCGKKKKEKMKTRRGRLHFSFQAQTPFLLHFTLGLLSAFQYSGNVPAEG